MNQSSSDRQDFVLCSCCCSSLMEMSQLLPVTKLIFGLLRQNPARRAFFFQMTHEDVGPWSLMGPIHWMASARIEAKQFNMPQEDPLIVCQSKIQNIGPWDTFGDSNSPYQTSVSPFKLLSQNHKEMDLCKYVPRSNKEQIFATVWIILYSEIRSICRLHVKKWSKCVQMKWNLHHTN